MNVFDVIWYNKKGRGSVVEIIENSDLVTLD